MVNSCKKFGLPWNLDRCLTWKPYAYIYVRQCEHSSIWIATTIIAVTNAFGK